MRLILLIIIHITFVINGYSQLAVIAHKDVEADSISKSQLLDFYSGDIREWENDLSLTVFDLTTKIAVRDTFYQFIGKSSSRMKSIWLKKMLLGEGDPPKVLENEKDMLETIAKTAGSIGFISSKFVDKSVKVLILIE
jgi:ABC-type phosphate transport system substrate-binding protein